MRYKAIVEYCGTGYSGWQLQDGLRTIQGVIQEALFQLTHQTIEVFASGRTDAGVHAFGQVIHFESDSTLTPYQLREGTNFHLRGETVKLISVEVVSENFHARFDACMRSYQYFILNRPVASALWDERAWHVKWPLNVTLMKEASLHLMGHHDFSSFRSQECQAVSALRTLKDINFAEEQGLLRINFFSRSFLHHQVRIMVGTLVHVGLGKIKPQALPDILAARKRAAAGPTAPSCGLYFMHVSYDKDMASSR